ncbi:MAG: thiamine pyrophosphate-binding protein [Elusimicrobiota bacterium]
MIKLSDYVANFLAENNIKHVFMVTGGGAMHLNNSIGKHKDIEVIFCHHEQACAMAAESYARLTGKIAAVCVTTGPGGINALNGVFGAWTDSIPMFVISGQVRYDTTVASMNLNLRQLGDQEFAKIINVASTMTKYAVSVTNQDEIKYHLEKGFYIANNGRKGPIWIDIPMNVQGAMINEKKLKGFRKTKSESYISPKLNNELLVKIIEKINNSQRPVLLVGNGIRYSGTQKELLTFISKVRIPVVTAWNAHDLIEDTNPFYIGRPGTVGDRAGNFAVQNADLLIVLGSRLNIRQIGYNYKTFARVALKIIVDIDEAELNKPTIKADIPICADVNDFLIGMNNNIGSKLKIKKEWLEWCLDKRKRYPVVLPDYWKKEAPINPYCFVQKLFDILTEDQIIVCGDGTACVTTFQAAIIKKGQRLYTNSGCASMGYDLPAAIGSCIGSNKKKIICITGDGSIMMNLQELGTISYLNLPIKIFLLNNNGYHSIRQTQVNFFGKPLIGVGPESGLGFPKFQKVCKAFEIRYLKCEMHSHLPEMIQESLRDNKPTLLEIFLDLKQQFAPKQSSFRKKDGQLVSRPLEDLAPFLSRDELLQNMIISTIFE